MSITDRIIFQGSPVAVQAPRGLGRLVGDALLGGQERAQAEYAARRKQIESEARPAHDRATRRLRQAQSELKLARHRYEGDCASLVLGEASELDVARIEGEIADLERTIARCAAAARELERRLPGVIRDPSGHILK